MIAAAAYEDEPMAEEPTALRRLQAISDRINRARDVESLVETTRAAFADILGLGRATLLVPEAGGRLVTIASRREGTTAASAAAANDAISGAGGADLRSRRLIPLLVEDRLVGVLSIEGRDRCAAPSWDDALFQVAGNQLASRLDHLAARTRAPVPDAGPRTRTVCFYPSDECVFVDGEYLTRSVPAKILWRLLTAHLREPRAEYTNRELRLDRSLGMPASKDNLESRLILLRKRLEQRCPEIRLVPTRRGCFALELGCAVELVEGTGSQSEASRT